jgi:flavin-dependent dehydrogenase
LAGLRAGDEAAEIAVVGGGLAGAAAACRLARAGRRVVLLEREPAAGHKVCGEFVSVEAARHLRELGADGADPLPALGAAPIERVRLVAGRMEAVADLPFRAFGLSRRRLDDWLLLQAERAGAVLRRGVAVQGIAAGRGGGVRLDTARGSFAAGRAVLATGKHDLRGHRREGPLNELVGLKLHVRLAAAQDRALAGHVELVLFKGGYAGLQQVEDGTANLCLLVAKDSFARAGRDWRALAAGVPHLARRLAGAEPAWPRPLAVYRIPYGYLHRGKAGEGPVYRVGDQLAVIPSFTGDGMAMALHGAGMAAAAILAGEPPAAFHARAAALFARPVRLAGLVAGAGAVPWLQGPMAAACRAFPALMSGIARATRIPGVAGKEEGEALASPSPA